MKTKYLILLLPLLSFFSCKDKRNVFTEMRTIEFSQFVSSYTDKTCGSQLENISRIPIGNDVAFLCSGNISGNEFITVEDAAVKSVNIYFEPDEDNQVDSFSVEYDFVVYNEKFGFHPANGFGVEIDKSFWQELVYDALIERKDFSHKLEITYCKKEGDEALDLLGVSFLEIDYEVTYECHDLPK